MSGKFPKSENIVELWKNLVEGNELLIGLVRGPRRRHEPHLVQLPLLAALFRQDQVPEVHRVEGAAENAYTHDSLANARLVIIRPCSSQSGNRYLGTGSVAETQQLRWLASKRYGEALLIYAPRTHQ